MNTKRKRERLSHAKAQYSLPKTTHEQELTVCACPPLSPLCQLVTAEQEPVWADESQEWEDNNGVLPVSCALHDSIRTCLNTLLPSTTSVSILLLHVIQREQLHFTPDAEVLQKRQRYHASANIVEQIMVNVRRAIRADDLVYLDIGKGAAIILLEVDQQGAHRVLERVYNSVNLLQAETLVPPLTRETDILLGIGSYPEQGPLIEHALADAGRVFHRLTLRPAITTRLWETMPMGEAPFTLMSSSLQEEGNFYCENATPSPSTDVREGNMEQSEPDTTSVPFLHLPTVLPERLRSLVTYSIAARYRCVPVGRDHHCLTVAMAKPTDTEALSALQAATGMTIFPVSCATQALDVLLREQW